MPHFLELVSAAAKSNNLREIKRLLADPTISGQLTKSTQVQLEVLSAALGGGLSVFHYLSEYLDASGTRYHIAEDKEKLFELLNQAIKLGDAWILNYLLGKRQLVAPTKVTRGMVVLGQDPRLRKQVATLVVETNNAVTLKYFLTQAHVFANDANELLDMFLGTVAKSLKVLRFFGALNLTKAQKRRLFDRAMAKGKPEIFKCLLDHPEFIKLLQNDKEIRQYCIVSSTQNLDSLRCVLAKDILVEELMAGNDDGVEGDPLIDDDDEPGVMLNESLQRETVIKVLKSLGSDGIKLLEVKQPGLVAKLKENKDWQSQAFEGELTTAAFKYLLDSSEIPEIDNSLRDDIEKGNAEVQKAALLASSRVGDINSLKYLLEGRPKVLQYLRRDKELQDDMCALLVIGLESLSDLDYFLEITESSEGIAWVKYVITKIIGGLRFHGWSSHFEEMLKASIERLHKQGESWHFPEDMLNNGCEGFQVSGKGKDSSYLEDMLKIETLRSQMASFNNKALWCAIGFIQIDTIRTLLKQPEVRKQLPAENHYCLRHAVDNIKKELKREVKRKLEREVKAEVEEIAERRNRVMAVLSLLIEAYRKEGIPLPKNLTIPVEGKQVTLRAFMDKSLWGYAGFHSVTAKREKEDLPFPPRLPIAAVRLIQEFTGAVPTQFPVKQLLDSLNHLGALQARVKEGAVKGDPKKEREIEIQKIMELLNRDAVGLEDGIPGGGRLRAEIEKALGKDTELSNRLIKLIESERMPITPLKKEDSAMDTSLDSAPKEVAVLDRAETSRSEGLYLSAAATQLKEQASKKGGQKRGRTGEPKTLISSSEVMVDESEGLEREQAVETPVETEAEGTSSYNSKRGKTAQSSEGRSGNRSPRSSSPG